MVTTPLFIDAFNQRSDPYFVMIFITICWIAVPLITSLRNIHVLRLDSGKQHLKLIMISILWTISFICTTYSSSKSRTPVDLQSIIQQANFPLTFLSRFVMIGGKCSCHQAVGFSTIIAGITITLIPTLSGLSSDAITNIYWSLTYLTGVFISAVSNVVEEKIMKTDNMSANQFMFWVNLYQLLMTSLLFWVNILPGIGLFTSLRDWSNAFINSMECIASCRQTLCLGLLNATAGIIAFYSALNLIKSIDANYVSLMGSISVPFSVTYWICSRDIPTTTVMCDYIGSFIIIMGFYYYRLKSEPEYEEISSAIDTKYQDEYTIV